MQPAPQSTPPLKSTVKSRWHRTGRLMPRRSAQPYDGHGSSGRRRRRHCIVSCSQDSTHASRVHGATAQRSNLLWTRQRTGQPGLWRYGKSRDLFSCTLSAAEIPQPESAGVGSEASFGLTMMHQQADGPARGLGLHSPCLIGNSHVTFMVTSGGLGTGISVIGCPRHIHQWL